MLNREQALQHVREHSGSALFWSPDGHLWKVESVLGGPGSSDAYEVRVEKEGILTLAFTRETPTPLERKAEEVAVRILGYARSSVEDDDYAPPRAVVRSAARLIVQLLNP